MDHIEYIICEKKEKDNWFKKRIGEIEADTFTEEVDKKMKNLASINYNRARLVDELVQQKKNYALESIEEVVSKNNQKVCVEFNDRPILEKNNPGLCIVFHRYSYRKGFIAELIFDFNFWFIKAPFNITYFFLEKVLKIFNILVSIEQEKYKPFLNGFKIQIDKFKNWYKQSVIDNLEKLQMFIATSLSIIEAKHFWAPLIYNDTSGKRPKLGKNEFIDNGIVCKTNLDINCKKIHPFIVKLEIKDLIVLACNFENISRKKGNLILKKILLKYKQNNILIGICSTKKYKKIDQLQFLQQKDKISVFHNKNIDIHSKYTDKGVIGLIVNILPKISLNNSSNIEIKNCSKINTIQKKVDTIKLK